MKTGGKMGKVIYLLTELLIMIAFIYLDAHNQIMLSNMVKFTGIVLNTLTMLILLGCRKKVAGAVYEKRNNWIAAALLLTLAADTFLILLDSYYLLGVCMFCLVEICYAAYLLGHAVKKGKDILIRLVTLLAALLIASRMGVWDELTAVALFSIVMLTWNVVFAWGSAGGKAPRVKASGRHLAWGLTLFWLCDICVGIRNAGDALSIDDPRVQVIASSLIWVFYLPAQVLILLSLWRNIYPQKKREKK